MKNNNNKGNKMNKLTKAGLTVLAGSMVAVSAQAVEMAVTGIGKLTHVNGHSTEPTGNPLGMASQLTFTGTGEVNGYATTLMTTRADQTGFSSASLSVDLGDMGKLTFDQGVGAGGISTIDDKTPTANEEAFDGLDAIVGDANGLVGGGNSGVIVYANSFMDMNLSVQVSKGNSAANADEASSGGTGGSSWDFALTNNTMYEGLDVGIGYGKIANGAQNVGSDHDTNEHMVAYANYTMGMITAGYTQSAIDDGETGGQNEYASGYGIAANINDSLSISYGEREVEHAKAGAADVTEDMKGYAIAYTMGSAKITYQTNETDSNGGTAGVNDEKTEITLSLAF